MRLLQKEKKDKRDQAAFKLLTATNEARLAVRTFYTGIVEVIDQLDLYKEDPLSVRDGADAFLRQADPVQNFVFGKQMFDEWHRLLKANQDLKEEHDKENATAEAGGLASPAPAS